MVEAKFMKLLDNSKILLREKWLYCIVDDFVTKQLPHNDMESESVICSGAQGRQSFDFNSRRAGTWFAVLGCSGVTELHSLR